MAFALIVAMTGQTDLFYRSNLQPRRPAKGVFGYSCHPMKSSKARICADVHLNLFYHCNTPAAQATIDLSDESIESRGSHALALVIRSMSGKLHCDRAVAFGSSMPAGNRQFRLRLFGYVFVLSYLLSPFSRSGHSCFKRGMDEHSLANHFHVLCK